MALTSEQLSNLRTHWPLVIQRIYPQIEDIPKGNDASLETMLATWRSLDLPRPSEAQVVTALDAVMADVAAEDQAEAEQAAARAAVVRDAADTLLTQIAAGLAANQNDRDELANVTTVAACRVAIGRMLNREAAMMDALERIVKYLKATA